MLFADIWTLQRQLPVLGAELRGEFEAVANRRRVVKASAEQSTEVRGVIGGGYRPSPLELCPAAIPPQHADRRDAELRRPQDVVLAISDHGDAAR